MELFPYYNHQNPMDVMLGKIVNFNISMADDMALTATLSVKIGSKIHDLGGLDLMAALPSVSANNFFSHFIFRCMQIAQVSEIMEMNGVPIWVDMEEDMIIGIGYERSGDWFYPANEFIEMEKL